MTTTLDGLGALLSKGGYEHQNKKDLLDNALGGCLLCKKVFDICYKGPWWRLP